MKRVVFILLICLNFPFYLSADEGMWLPIHIQRLNYTDMEKMGLQLTAEEIYSINHSSLKDAVVNLSGGSCTGEIISPNGLMLTNHHCGYDYIQQHSTVENDILTNGFWAQSYEEELPNDGLYVQFLVRMEDVTQKVLKDVTVNMSEKQRDELVANSIEKLAEEAKGDTHYDVVIKPFFNGNEYYLFVYETFTDVRLVGNPPESIGKFGGDTDNWMWPRHTGDFSLFRVYTGPDGKPAPYSKENIPLKPKHYLPVSISGVQENDFAFILGYPGSTNRYLTSYGVKMAIEETNPARVKLREKRLSIMKEFMDKDPAVRLGYAAKYAHVSNYWKYFIGQTKGLKDLDIYSKKSDLEKSLTNWLKEDQSKIKKFGNPVGEIKKAYDEIRKYNLPFYYYLEGGFGVEFIRYGYQYKELMAVLENDSADDETIKNTIDKFDKGAGPFYKDYNPKIDKKVFTALLGMFYADVDPEFYPEFFASLRHPVEANEPFFSDFQIQEEGNLGELADYVFENSILTDKDKLLKFFENPNKDVLANDPGYKVAISVYNGYRDLSGSRGEALDLLSESSRKFIAALQEMNTDKKYYPDANSTMRLTYGKVQSYEPRDAVLFNYETTLKGVMEKEDPSNPEFIVHPKLKELYEAKDFGPYGENGKLPVGFITNNDITGGNSGSPVIDRNGNLIGIAFDGNWEAMSGDITFEPELQRCINVDIRYTLFIIDKFAGAKHLIDEMTLVTSDDVKKESKKSKKK